jgi:hypothetical protein
VWLQLLEDMVPDFDRSWIRYCLVHRERYVEPLRPLNGMDLIPAVTSPIGGLYLATTAQIYPALTNAESVTAHARAVANAVLESRAKFDPVRIPKSVEEMVSEHAAA